jgi:hypothetical protein
MTRKGNRILPNEEASKRHEVSLDDEAISRLLEALHQELPCDAEVDLDALFSEVLSKGLLSEKEIDEGFEQFLKRKVGRDLVTGRAELEPLMTCTIGERVREVRSARGLSYGEAAAELQVPVEWMELLEASREPYEFAEVFPTARRLSVDLGGAELHQCLTFLQRLRVIDKIGCSGGVSLKAARKISGS